VGTPALWLGFFAGILLLLGMDLGLSGRKGRDISFGEAAAWGAIWVAASLGFNLFLWRRYGAAPALEFFTGYLIEKSLSLDNLLLFVLLFRYFAVEPRYQHRVLYWGVFGAFAMRGAMIGAGVLLIQRFHWMFELFGVFLVFAGLRMLFRKSREAHPEQNPVFRWARKFLPFTETYEGGRFFARREGVWRATPLLLVLLGVEAFDLIFALDSIPAVLGITRDPFIVFSSNACAVLGLRSLYFLLAGALPRFRYLGAGVSLVLLFIGAKMLGARWVPISTPLSLLVVAAIVAGSIGASLAASRARKEWRARPAKARTSVKD
jgi:tellurite resistance protein TerC